MKRLVSIVFSLFLVICVLSVACATTRGSICDYNDGGEMIRHQVTQRELIDQYYEWDDTLNAIVQVRVYIVTVTIYFQCSVNPDHIIIQSTSSNELVIRTPNF